MSNAGAADTDVALSAGQPIITSLVVGLVDIRWARGTQPCADLRRITLVRRVAANCAIAEAARDGVTACAKYPTYSVTVFPTINHTIATRVGC